MKVLCIILLAASASAARSGPYLPSGWKPDGPAFLLPGEVEQVKTADNPLKETVQVEAEGSDFLREYGPPKSVEVSQDLTKQALPDVEIDQPFNVLDVKENQINNVEVQTEAVEIDAATTQASEAFEIEGKSVTDAEQTSEVNEETTAADITEAYTSVTEDVSAVTEAISTVTEVITEVKEVERSEEREGKSVKTEEVVQVEVKENVGKVNSIADALVSLDNEIKSQQVQNIQVVEQKSVDSGNLDQAPEGFLEYGPPGFREYGPPKGLLRTEVAEENVETNETRRRRFSPKFSAAATSKVSRS